MKKLLIFIYCYFSMLGLWAQKYRDAEDSIIFFQLRKLAIADVSEGFTFEKSFDVKISQGNLCRVPDRKLILSKGFTYEIVAKDFDMQAKNTLITMIFNDKREEIVTSWYKGYSYEKVKFKCSKTGVYYLYFHFKDSNHYKGAAALSFRMD